MSKVFQGVLQSSPKTVTNASECLRLWSHECLRVFSDRLIEKKDTDWFFELLCRMLKDKCKKDWEALTGSDEPQVLYGDFMNSESDDYVHIPDIEKLIGAMNTHLEDYNAVSKVRVTAGARDNPEPNPNP